MRFNISYFHIFIKVKESSKFRDAEHLNRQTNYFSKSKRKILGYIAWLSEEAKKASGSFTKWRAIEGNRLLSNLTGESGQIKQKISHVSSHPRFRYS